MIFLMVDIIIFTCGEAYRSRRAFYSSWSFKTKP